MAGFEHDAHVNVAKVVEMLQLPQEERGPEGELIDPFPAGDMRLDRSEYSGSSFTGSEMTNDQDEHFDKDSKGRRPDQVFVLAGVPLKDVAEKQAVDAERKKRARVAEGRPEDDSAGDASSSQSSEDASSEDASSEDASSEDASSEDQSSHAEKKQRTDDV